MTAKQLVQDWLHLKQPTNGNLEGLITQALHDAVEEADKGWCLGCNHRGGECQCAELGSDAEWMSTVEYVKYKINDAVEETRAECLARYDRVVAEVVVDEREACAKVAEEHKVEYHAQHTSELIAVAIRARK